MRRKQLIWFLAAGLFFVACERSSEMTSAPEVATPKITRSSKISISEAIEVAMEGLSMLDDTKTRSQQRVVDPSKIETYVRPATRSGVADTLFYVVNFADSAGFAIIAADPAASPQLLAVAESGSYSPNGIFEEIPRPTLGTELPETKYPLPQPNPYPDLKPVRPITPDTTITYSDWVTVGPYLEVKWGQKAPYNTYCEKVGMEEPCATGCTATALAQILSYYQYPTDEMEVTFTKDPEYAEFYSHPEVGNFVTLDWTELKQHVVKSDNDTCSATNHTNLAILFRQLGHLLGMTYGEESNAPFGNIFDVLTGFGYTCNLQDDYNWDIVRGELDSARLVAMSGVKVNEDNEETGHVWVIDGYKTRTKITNISGKDFKTEYNYLHINWGWSGNYNGYYLSGIFDTTTIHKELDEEPSKEVSTYYDKNFAIITGIKTPMLGEE